MGSFCLFWMFLGINYKSPFLFDVVSVLFNVFDRKTKASQNMLKSVILGIFFSFFLMMGFCSGVAIYHGCVRILKFR